MKDETIGIEGLAFHEPLLFEQGSQGRRGCSLPENDVPEVKPERLLPKKLLRHDIPGFPELSEVEVVPPLHPVIAMELRGRSWLLPLGLLHDEI